MSLQLRFGSYDFPNTFHLAEEPSVRAVTADKLPRTDGARVPTATLAEKRLTVRGMLIKGPLDTSDFRTRLDAMKAALATGPANFTADSDRYWRNVQAAMLAPSYGETGWGRIAEVQIDLTTGDPFQYSASATSDTWTVSASGQTHGVTAGGNAYALPSLSITVGGVGAQTIAFTVTNSTTGESFTLAGAVTGGDVIVVDSLAQTVKIGATDKISLFDGQFIRLAVGANTLSEAYTGGSITQIVTAFNARWY